MPPPQLPPHLIPALYWEKQIGQRPEDFADRTIPAWKRQAIAFILRNGANAHPAWNAMGWADCRICGAHLGSGDLTAFGHVWPEKAEHYVIAHDVWTPACEAILACALATR